MPPFAHHGYLVGLFDVLGFEHRLTTLGLKKLHEKYEQLVEIVQVQNECHRALMEKGFEGVFHAADGVVFSYEVRAAYSSDSILIWANRCWDKARSHSKEELSELSKHPALGWLGCPIPPDIFLDMCSALICRSIEIGLPLRGAISMGEAVIDEGRRIFLGQPIVDAARLEGSQKVIGATPHKAFHAQQILPHFMLPYRSHFKNGEGEEEIYKACLEKTMSCTL
ncbi:MAG: hypothetical protein Q8K62_00375, partial [Thiobacillus sp.]|nr:hypothetical protein [Thiobacillus sp.]